MDIIEATALIASIFTIISVCINIIQWRSKKSLISTLKSRSQASYNYFFHIAEHSDRIRGTTDSANPSNAHLASVKQEASAINGFSDAARYDIISYSREHLNFIPIREHPATPYPNKLSKPSKKQKDNVR